MVTGPASTRYTLLVTSFASLCCDAFFPLFFFYLLLWSYSKLVDLYTATTYRSSSRCYIATIQRLIQLRVNRGLCVVVYKVLS